MVEFGQSLNHAETAAAAVDNRPLETTPKNPVPPTRNRGVMTAKKLVFEDFADKIGEVFPICDRDVPRIPLTLTQAELQDSKWQMPGIRPPFSLVFLAQDAGVLPQRLYRMEHVRLGELEIFLVPVAKVGQAVSYQATFN